MIKSTLILTVLIVWLSVIPSRASAADAERGKALYEENCTVCHSSEKFTRTDHHVRSLNKLRTQVWNCQDGAGYDWTQVQIDDVVAYLNAEFYHFK